MTYQNYSLKQLQQIDAAHHLHPFTDHKELRDAGSRMITRADGPVHLRFRGQRDPRRHGRPVVRQRRLWPRRAGRSRLRADEGTALLQLLLQMLDADAGAAGQEARRNRAEQHQPGVLTARPARKPTTRRCAWCATTGRWKASRRRTASSRATWPITARRSPARRWAAWRRCTASSAARCPTSSM